MNKACHILTGPDQQLGVDGDRTRNHRIDNPVL